MSRPTSSLCALIAAAAVGLVTAAPAADAPRELGQQLFEGRLPLKGQIVGHHQPLPVQASRCMNCHGIGTAPPTVKPAASDATRSFGPALTADALTQAAKRRGGPPSRYDQDAFCKLLRTGIDPAYVIIPRSMPRYELSDADCGALWTYLTHTDPPR